MRNIRIVFSYEGGRFFGSQAQLGKRTVQEEIEKAIKRITGENLRLMIAGRTDRGVHGLRQSANFKTASLIPIDRFARALNSRLAEGIRVLDAFDVPSRFDSRRDAKKREYIYFLFNGEEIPVFFLDKALFVREPLNIKKMAKAAKLFIGKHDFRSFSAQNERANSSIRCVRELEIKGVGSSLIRKLGSKGRLIFIRISADSFCYRMVRGMVGALIEVGSGKSDLNRIKEMLVVKDCSKRCKIVEPCGLYLSEVKY